MNQEIRDAGKRKSFLLSVIGEDEDNVISKDLLMCLDVCYTKLNECYTSVPEITERDHQMDRYWDKKFEQHDAIEYGQGLENSIKFGILSAEFTLVADKIAEQIRSDETLSDAHDDLMTGLMDAEADYMMYGCDD